ncbi:MAG TPA: RNA polymerase sigma factor SigI [Acidimicrobiales bacterium]|nr:RNA polymerase sigma factor SigI [Acidimicrobiales bacterium]
MAELQEQADDRLGRLWREHHPFLVDLAFGMLGDIGAAEDAVQEAFARLTVADIGAIEDPRGWLVVVTSRICLDHVRSARVRRERPQETDTLERAEPVPAQHAVDPADRITLDDEVSLALLVVLQRLKPAERVAFVLHDVFGQPFESVADTMGRPVATCRQLARRARLRITSAGKAPAEVEVAAHRRVVERFIQACASGDVDALLPLLDPEVWGAIDLGPHDSRTGRTASGAPAVAANLVRYFGSLTLVSHPIAPGAVVLAFTGHELNAVITLDVRHDRVAKIHVIADPEKMALLGRQLTPAD